MPKIDLHTHSASSPDGSIDLAVYKNCPLDVVAITDHDTIDFAIMAQKTLGPEKIIVGEEISTVEGEIIGLYLSKKIEPGLTAKQTVEQIKQQHGLVYIPHPFETVRSGVTLKTLNTIADSVDIIEAPNGRSLQSRDTIALEWAKQHAVAVCASSDAHRAGALGKTYTEISSTPTPETLLQNLENAKIVYRKPSLIDLLAPKLNRLRKKLKRL